MAIADDAYMDRERELAGSHGARLTPSSMVLTTSVS